MQRNALFLIYGGIGTTGLVSVVAPSVARAYFSPYASEPMGRVESALWQELGVMLLVISTAAIRAAHSGGMSDRRFYLGAAVAGGVALTLREAVWPATDNISLTTVGTNLGLALVAGTTLALTWRD